MPLYTFVNIETKQVEERIVKLDDYDKFLQDNPQYIRMPEAASIVSSSGDRVKTDDGFKEVLSKIAEKHPYTPLGERYGPKDSKTVANRKVLEKIRKKK